MHAINTENYSRSLKNARAFSFSYSLIQAYILMNQLALERAAMAFLKTLILYQPNPRMWTYADAVAEDSVWFLLDIIL